MMKLFLLAVAIATLVGAGSAVAGGVLSLDEPISAAPAPGYNWTGLYLGVNLGYGWGSDSVRVSGDAAATEPALAAGVLPRSLAGSPAGIIGGGQGGYNFQIDRWVLGVEADVQGADISSSESVSRAVPGFFTFVTKASQTLDLFGSARGRVGFAVIDPLLLYVTGGLAYGNVKLSASSTNPGCVGVCTSGSTSALNAGWTVGGGLEYAFSRRWSVKGEYLYYDLGELSKTVTDAKFPGIFQTYRADFAGNLVRFGVNFRF